MINFVCAKTVPDSTKLRLKKGSKSKFPRGSMPPDPPSLPHACTQICACSPKNPYNLILPPLGKKLIKTLNVFVQNAAQVTVVDKKKLPFHFQSTVIQ